MIEWEEFRDKYGAGYRTKGKRWRVEVFEEWAYLFTVSVSKIHGYRDEWWELQPSDRRPRLDLRRAKKLGVAMLLALEPELAE